MCRKTTNSYCKDTILPICSKECKWKHLELEQLAYYQNINKLEEKPNIMSGGNYCNDSIEIFRYICHDSQDNSALQ